VHAIEAPKLIRILWSLYEYHEALSFCTKHHQTTPVVVLKSFSNTASLQSFENNIEDLVVILRTQIRSTLQSMPSEILHS
jgi:heme oxygenase